MTSSLPIRETILGVLKSRDSGGTCIIHSSDFRTAVSDLGFPMGSQVVADILIHCRVNPSNGDIDFSQLESELMRERKLANAKSSPIKSVSSSMGTSVKPWRADTTHRDKLQAERQSKIVQENRPDIHDIYRKFVHNQYTVDEVVSALEGLQVVPTRLFMTLLNQNKASSDVKFAEFTRTLVTYDPRGNEVDHAAGAPHPSLRPSMLTIADTDHGLFVQRIRVNKSLEKVQDQRSETGGSRNMQRKKIFMEIDDQGNQHGRNRGSRQVVENTFSDTSNPSLLSHNQLDMLNGVIGEPVPLAYNIEQKLLREQVLVALRRLQGGELSLADFQDRVYSMGLELPEIIVRELQRSELSGHLDLRKCVEILDAEVFKVRALEERITSADVNASSRRLLAELSRRGSNALSELSAVMAVIYRRGDQTLSFNEFKRGIRQYGLQTSDEDLRVLFTSYDKNGDGALSFDEFKSGIRGPLNPHRDRLVRYAFQKLNRSSSSTVNLTDIADVYDPSLHPDVVAGRKTQRDEMRELLNAMGNESGQVTLEEFTDYFANLSAFMPDDDTFTAMIKQAWGLDEKKPAPVLIGNARWGAGPDAVIIPRAKQAHGDCIAWEQEQSELEVATAMAERDRTRRVIDHDNKRTNAIVFPKKGDPESGDFLMTEHKLMGGSQMRPTGLKNKSDLNRLIPWNSPRKPQGTVSASPQNARTDRFPVSEEEDVRFVTAGYQWSDLKTKHFGGEAPFGMDIPPPIPTRSPAAPKSLADHMQASSSSSSPGQSSGESLYSPTKANTKNKSKSLLELMNGQ